MKALARKIVPKPLWLKLSNLKARLADVFESEDDLVPPRHLSFVGQGDFKKIGNEFLGHFRKHGGLQPHHAVLDVGCGIGRMAVPLTSYLDEKGRYDGIDIVAHGVEWCQEHVTPRFPRFKFQLADVYNPEYNPNGKQTSVDYRFPFPDAHFDFVFMTSVFTHMRPPEVANYLKETARVLKPGGCSLITWFLLNEESRSAVAAGKSTLDFRFEVDGCLTTNEAVPEEAIAFPEEVVMQVYDAAGLTLDGSPRRGSWCGRPDFVSYQDFVVAKKHS